MRVGRAVASTVWLALVLAALPGTATPRAGELEIGYDDGRPPGSLPLDRIDDASDELYVSADGLARALRLERFWKPETRKMVFKIDERRIQVTVDTRLVIDGEEDVLLHVPVRYREGAVMLPLEFLERVLAPAAGGTLRFDRAALALRVGVGGIAGSDVTAVDYDASPQSTRCRVHLTRPLRQRTEATSPEMIRLTLFGAHVDPVALAADRPTPGVRSVRAEQRQDAAVLYFELERAIPGFESTVADGGRTVILALQRSPEPIPAPEFKLPRKLPEPASTRAARDSFDVLVLDPGHGGYDRGVQASGLVEKDVTLSLAEQLEPLLERDLGMRVVLVRSGDRALTAENRAEIANRAHGSALISLHCNGWVDAKTRGFEALSEAPEGGAGSAAVSPEVTADADAVAAPAASAGAAAGTSRAADVERVADFRPWYTAQTPYVERSRQLAELLQMELGRRLVFPNRGLRQTDVDVLKGVAMPAVLLEIGFLTNPEEAAAISSPDFAPQLAAGIVAALQRLRGLKAETSPDSPSPEGGARP